MTLPNSITAYGDVAQVLATALEVGGLTIRFDKESKLHLWRKRAYKYRQLLRKQRAKAAGEKDWESFPTEYDMMRLEHPEPGVLRIRFTGPDVGFSVETLDGQPVELRNDVVVGLDPTIERGIESLERDALALRGELGLEVSTEEEEE